MLHTPPFPLPAARSWSWRGWRHGADLAEWLRLALLEEHDRWLLWLPVALGLGIALCFALPAAPSLHLGLLVGAAALLVLLLAWWRAGRIGPGGVTLAIGLATLLLGFTIATLRVHAVAAPLIEREGSYRVEGRILGLEDNGRGHRLLLDQLALDGVPAERTPRTVRLTLRSGGSELRPGDRVRLLARLQRPLAPSLPGGFDFGRQAWFEQLGGLGFAMGKAERIAAAPPRSGEGGWLADAAVEVAALRSTISARILAASPDAAGAVAAALLTGVRAGIDQTIWRDFQISGLAHILSISGLHMVLVAGVTVISLRWLLALIPPLALRVPVKKIAAAVAIPVSAFYMLLAGAPVPTQRSFLMITVGLIALILDRNPLSMRILAWAALVVLLIRPEALVGASFQLSFAAVVALSAAYESPAVQGLLKPDRDSRTLHRAWLYVAGVAMTTLIASTATAPLGAYHFQTVPTYGVLANLLAVPLTSFVIMPAGMVAMLLMPLGLDGGALWLMTGGVDLLLLIARLSAALPGASVRIGLMPAPVLAIFLIGGLWLAIWRRSWRWLGLAPCALALIAALLHRQPDLLLHPYLDMALRQGEGGVRLAEWRRHGLVKDAWLRSAGTTAAEPWPKAGAPAVDGIACDQAGCIVRLGQHTVSLLRGVAALAEDCARADLVIARVGPESCPAGGAAMIGPRALQRSGGLALSLDGDELVATTVAQTRAGWPWSGR